MSTSRVTGSVLGTKVEVTDFDRVCRTILELARLAKPAYVCFATAHMLVEATRDAAVEAAYHDATIIAPDGAPVAWCLRLKGHPEAMCVSGPRTMPLLLQYAAANNLRVGFHGGRPETLTLLRERLLKQIPELQIVWSYSPPFRSLSVEEQQTTLKQISAAGVQLLFIGLGSPKQERWMQEFSPSLNCVCLGVGAAFEFLSGEKVLPPVWVQKMGLTWLVRLCQEPRRLARRNLCSFIFAAKALQEIATYRLATTQLSRPRQAAGLKSHQSSLPLKEMRVYESDDAVEAWSPLVVKADSLVTSTDPRALSHVQDLNLEPTSSLPL